MFGMCLSLHGQRIRFSKVKLSLTGNPLFSEPSIKVVKLINPIGNPEFGVPLKPNFMITRLLKQFAVSASLVLLLPQISFSSSDPGASPALKSFFDYLSGTEVPEITIEADFSLFFENRKTDEYQPATLFLDAKEGPVVTLESKIKTRGKYRRRICDFPPIKLNLPKGKLRELGLREDFDKYKIVTHCLDDKTASQENVVKEFLAYQLYNQLTPFSFRARLLKVEYVDTSGKMGRVKRYAILLEDNDELADRLQLTKCDCLNPEASEFNAPLEMTHALFQFMIGNADWTVKMARNVELFKNQKGEIVPVPFDFDFSGLVNAAYAVPNSDYQLTSVRQRLYLGVDRPNPEMKPIFELFRNKEPDFLAAVMQTKHLSRETRVDVADFLGTFFHEIGTLQTLPEADWAGLLTRKQPAAVDGANADSGK